MTRRSTMQRGWKSAALALVATAALASSAFAQRGGGGFGRGGGANLLRMPEVQAELKITDEQRTKIQTIVDDQRNAMRELFQGGGGGDRQAMMQKMQELRKQTDDKIAAVLTDDQKSKWKEMTGAPFTFPAFRPGNR